MKFRWPSGFAISDTPVRPMVGRSSQTIDGYFRTNKRPIRDGDELTLGRATETVGGSPHEHRFLILAEMDPNVEAVAPQPTWITFELDGALASHVPDYAITVAGVPEMIECTGLRSWRSAELRKRHIAAARLIGAAGWRYHIALDHDMCADPRSEAAEDLWRRHRPTFHPLHQMAAADILSRKSEMPIADLLTALEGRLGSASATFEQLLSLAANGRVFIDLLRPIGRGSLVRYADRSTLPERLIPRRQPADALP